MWTMCGVMWTMSGVMSTMSDVDNEWRMWCGVEWCGKWVEWSGVVRCLPVRYRMRASKTTVLQNTVYISRQNTFLPESKMGIFYEDGCRCHFLKKCSWFCCLKKKKIVLFLETYVTSSGELSALTTRKCVIWLPSDVVWPAMMPGNHKMKKYASRKVKRYV